MYSDFYYYKSGIYHRTSSSSYLGAHAVKVIGWGKDSSTLKKYWII